MVLKDWTKTERNEWHKFHKNGKKLPNGKLYDGILIAKTVNGDWIFNSFYRKVPKKYKYKEGKLKTRKDALKLAKDYMERN